MEPPFESGRKAPRFGTSNDARGWFVLGFFVAFLLMILLGYGGPIGD
jgi:hypothetical protein